MFELRSMRTREGKAGRKCCRILSTRRLRRNNMYDRPNERFRVTLDLCDRRNVGEKSEFQLATIVTQVKANRAGRRVRTFTRVKVG